MLKVLENAGAYNEIAEDERAAPTFDELARGGAAADDHPHVPHAATQRARLPDRCHYGSSSPSSSGFAAPESLTP